MTKIFQKTYFYVSLISCLALLFCLAPKITEAASLNFALNPYQGEIRPGGAILIGTNPIFDTNEATIEAWINPKSYPTGIGEDEGRTILWNGDGTGGHDPYWILLNTSGRLEARVDYDSPYQQHIFVSSDPIELNTWHHFALVIGAVSTDLYIDGVKQPGTFLNGGPACKGTNYLAVGRSMWHWNPYEGLIDEMRIWKVARTVTEIQNDRWTGSVSGDNPDLVAYWDYEQGANSSVLYDLTPNHLNGGIQGCTWTNESAPAPPCQADVWSCGEWNACSISGTQTRTCAKTFECSTVDTPSPATSQSCVYTPPTCTSWIYSDWSACQPNGTQTRSIASSTPNGCAGGNPVLTQNCIYTPSPCTADVWSCGEWGFCFVNGKQSRNCTKTFDCLTANTPSPATSQKCTYQKPTCTADTWTCGAWGECSLSGIQNRSCTKTFDCPDIQTAPPTTEQYCKAPNKPTNQSSSSDEATIAQLKSQIADLQRQIMILLTQLIQVLQQQLGHR
ncbi:MAG: LamG domain-containing protein [Candidatus Pacebacteria bacterium]|nr:LamG domain-containing protein [Candidatus Paceibacterota bacterium]